MPRIELIPADYDSESGDGTPTVDVCASCALDFVEGDKPPNEGNSETPYEGVVGCTDVQPHPSYVDEGNYSCDNCCEILTDADE